jgi:hypothetical protein
MHKKLAKDFSLKMYERFSIIGLPYIQLLNISEKGKLIIKFLHIVKDENLYFAQNQRIFYSERLNLAFCSENIISLFTFITRPIYLDDMHN